ncbi:MAG TPA: Clp protease N-terminal domain-containing protein, partial [Mariprofundaceae bacterium]|nr:Clp protease N-terminal domain-containing protein [Mariprofundaceae bacterium]
MDMNRMTQKVREALASAQTLAARLSHQEVDGEHVLAELLAQQDGLAPRLIERVGAS